MNTEERIEIERNFWDGYAGKYDRFIQSKTRNSYPLLMSRLEKDTRASLHMLEVATGTGLLSIALSDSIPTITATDLSSEMIKLARRKALELHIENIFFKQEGICKLSFGNKVFDTVLASNVLHLLFEPRKALQEIKRVLSDNGLLILPTYCHGQSWKTKSLSRIMGLAGFRARQRWSEQSLVDFVESEGFVVLKAELINDTIPLAYIVATKKPNTYGLY